MEVRGPVQACSTECRTFQIWAGEGCVVPRFWKSHPNLAGANCPRRLRTAGDFLDFCRMISAAVMLAHLPLVRAEQAVKPAPGLVPG